MLIAARCSVLAGTDMSMCMCIDMEVGRHTHRETQGCMHVHTNKFSHFFVFHNCVRRQQDIDQDVIITFH